MHGESLICFFIQHWRGSRQGPGTDLEARNVSVHCSTNHTSSRVLSLSCHRCKQSIPVKSHLAERQTINDLNGSTLWQQMRKTPRASWLPKYVHVMAEHNSHKSDLIIECTDWRGMGGANAKHAQQHAHCTWSTSSEKESGVPPRAATSANSSVKQCDKALRNSPSDYRLARLHHLQGETDINKHVISQSEHLIMLIRFPLWLAQFNLKIKMLKPHGTSTRKHKFT